MANKAIFCAWESSSSFLLSIYVVEAVRTIDEGGAKALAHSFIRSDLGVLG
jgi:hypothetical protein